MDEMDFRAQLTAEELERRAFIISFKVYDFALLERLNKYSTEYEKNWDTLINAAITKFLDDIEAVQRLRL
jgi:hypothetical protein